VDNFLKIVDALTKLIGSFAWPVTVLVILWWFGAALREFLTGVDEGSVKGFGIEASAKMKATQAIVAADLEKAPDITLNNSQRLQLRTGVGKSFKIADLVTRSVSLEATVGKSILWVDDQPDNNTYERLAFQALGINVEFSKDTKDAINRLLARKYDVIISDMVRPEGEKAGYDLLEKIKELKLDIPFVLYSSAYTTNEEIGILSGGAFGSTSKASELIELVVSAIAANEQSKSRLEPTRIQRLRNLLAHRTTKTET
jgi:CheY-like chemotaxis protein